MSNPWDLAPTLDRLLAFRQARDWGQFHRPKELAAALAIEAGELQEVFLWRDPEPAKDIVANPNRMERVREELADVTIFLLLLSHDLGVDLQQAVAEKIDKNERRYSVERHKGVAEKAEHND